MSPDERTRLLNYCRDLSDEDLVDFAAKADADASDAVTHSKFVSGVLEQRMREDGVAIESGTDYIAELKTSRTDYKWEQGTLRAAWHLLEANGLSPENHLQPLTGMKVVHSGRLMVVLEKLGPKAAEIVASVDKRPTLKIEFRERLSIDEEKHDAAVDSAF